MVTRVKAPHGILLVDDDEDILELIGARAADFGTTLTAASTLAEARCRIEQALPALILLDINLPDGDGLAFCSSLRAGGYTGIIIMLTARISPRDRIDGLEGGADDYLAKPFELRELDARVRNWLRRSGGAATAVPERFRFARFGAWRLDLIQRRLVAPDDSITMLSFAEFDVLRRMIERPHIEMSREVLMPERRETVHMDRALDNRMLRLRHKLAAYAPDPLIVTVRNRGFMLAVDVYYERR